MSGMLLITGVILFGMITVSAGVRSLIDSQYYWAGIFFYLIGVNIVTLCTIVN